MPVSRECLDLCLEVLLRRRTNYEGDISALASKPLPPETDFDKGGRLELPALRTAQMSMVFANLRYVNLRIEAIKAGRFKGVCSSCQKDIREEDLIESPLMEKCADCQKKANGKH